MNGLGPCGLASNDSWVSLTCLRPINTSNYFGEGRSIDMLAYDVLHSDNCNRRYGQSFDTAHLLSISRGNEVKLLRWSMVPETRYTNGW